MGEGAGARTGGQCKAIVGKTIQWSPGFEFYSTTPNQVTILTGIGGARNTTIPLASCMLWNRILSRSDGLELTPNCVFDKPSSGDGWISAGQDTGHFNIFADSK